MKRDPYTTGCWLIWAASGLIFLIFVVGVAYIWPNAAYLKG